MNSWFHFPAKARAQGVIYASALNTWWGSGSDTLCKQDVPGGLSVSTPKGRHPEALYAALHPEILSSQSLSQGAKPGLSDAHTGIIAGSCPRPFPQFIFKNDKRGNLLQRFLGLNLQITLGAAFSTYACLSSSSLLCFPRRYLGVCSLFCLMPLQLWDNWLCSWERNVLAPVDMKKHLHAGVSWYFSLPKLEQWSRSWCSNSLGIRTGWCM